ncbi:MAG TPA: ATP-binding protein [Mycobacteriales bacterium]
MELTLTLCLPRDAASVPLARTVASDVLGAIGFDRGEVGDVELALSEACGNVIRHSGAGDEYEVHLTVRGDVVSIDVEDKGPGLPEHLLPGIDGSVAGDAETGRGLLLMQALVDELRFERAAETGSIVRMTRRLHTRDGSPAQRLATRRN